MLFKGNKVDSIVWALKSEREMSRPRCLQLVWTQEGLGEAVQHLHYRSSCVRPSRTYVSEWCSESKIGDMKILALSYDETNIPRRLCNYGRVDEAKSRSRMSRRPVGHTGSYRDWEYNRGYIKHFESLGLKFHDLVRYWDASHPPIDEDDSGCWRWLGVAYRVVLICVTEWWVWGEGDEWERWSDMARVMVPYVIELDQNIHEMRVKVQAIWEGLRKSADNSVESVSTKGLLTMDIVFDDSLAWRNWKNQCRQALRLYQNAHTQYIGVKV
jgi:hypothetical protein